MKRREVPDPAVVRMAADRLQRLLSEQRPRRASVPTAAPEADDPDVIELPADLDDLPPRAGFGRWHVGVIVGLVIVGLLSSGWALLRARPVALAAGPTLSATTPALSPATPSGPTDGSATPTTRSIVVHVLGAVRRPGLVELSEGSRVQDALSAAGGLRSRADPSELNLARVLSDGEQIVVGTKRRPAGEVRDGGGGGGSGSGGGSSGTGSLDLNRATQAELEALPGIGPVTAGKILAWRNEHGRFTRVEDLQEVSGIGPKIYAQIAPHVRV